MGDFVSPEPEDFGFLARTVAEDCWRKTWCMRKYAFDGVMLLREQNPQSEF